MKASHALLGLGILSAGFVLWKNADAHPQTRSASLEPSAERYMVTSTGTETILLNKVSGETWQLTSDESGTNWTRLPAPGGIVHHKWGASPFTEVIFNGDSVNDSVSVEYQQQQYQLVSVSGYSTRTLLEQSRHHFGSRSDQWQKGFAEDLSKLLREMGTPAGDDVSLELKDLQSNRLVSIAHAPMTKDNRQEVWHRRNDPRRD